MFKEPSDSGPRSGGKAPVVKLSPAEAEVVAQVTRGLTNKEIAAALGKSPATIGNHLGRIYRKLGVRNRIRLMVLFRG